MKLWVLHFRFESAQFRAEAWPDAEQASKIVTSCATNFLTSGRRSQIGHRESACILPIHVEVAGNVDGLAIGRREREKVSTWTYVRKSPSSASDYCMRGCNFRSRPRSASKLNIDRSRVPCRLQCSMRGGSFLCHDSYCNAPRRAQLERAAQRGQQHRIPRCRRLTGGQLNACGLARFGVQEVPPAGHSARFGSTLRPLAVMPQTPRPCVAQGDAFTGPHQAARLGPTCRVALPAPCPARPSHA